MNIKSDKFQLLSFSPSKKVISRFLCITLIHLFALKAFGQFGPGGVGNVSGTSTLKIWYCSSFGVSTTGTIINGITNRAGITGLDLSETGTQRPTLVNSAVNGYPEISFNGANRLRTGLNLTTSNFVVDQASSFLVCRADNTTQSSCAYTTDPYTVDRFSNHVPWSGGTVFFDIGSCCGSYPRIQIAGLAGLTNYSIWSYDANPTAGKQLYRNGAFQTSAAASSSTYTGHSTQRFNLGGNTSSVNGYEGDMTEVIVYNTTVNSTQRILIENYLSAKYGLASASNDLYLQDNPANGNYDFDVAGIGRTTITNLHNDAQGTGIVRILNPGGLGNNEFLIWGHNNGPLGTFGSTDFPAGMQGRWFREWRVNEVDVSGTAVDVGAIDIRFDLTGLGTVTTSDLRLLVDTDNDGVFNDETPISGATNLGSNVYQFAGVTAIGDGMRFTLGTINQLNTPLPIELINFEARVEEDNSVRLFWQTAAEINNDYFSIQKMINGVKWVDVANMAGAGNSFTPLSYSFIDPNPYFGISYYRLKQTDFNGGITYSAIQSVMVERKQELSIYPNPAENYLIIEGDAGDLNSLKVLDITGKEITSVIPFIISNKRITLDLIHLEKGIFMLQTSSETKKFIKL